MDDRRSLGRRCEIVGDDLDTLYAAIDDGALDADGGERAGAEADGDEEGAAARHEGGGEAWGSRLIRPGAYGRQVSNST